MEFKKMFQNSFFEGGGEIFNKGMRKICKFKVPKRYAKGRFAIKAYIGLNQMHVCFFFVSTIKKIIFSHDQKSFQKRMIKMKKK